MEGHAIVSAARERAGMSREALGRAAGVSTRTVYDVEQGLSPSVATLQAIAEALSLTDEERAALLAPGAWTTRAVGGGR